MDSKSEERNKFEEYISNMISNLDEELDPKFVQDFMFSLDSKEKFCIPAEKLLEWKVYKYKRDVKRKLLQLEYEEGKNFYATKRKTKGRPSESIKLTIDCFKEICMAASNKNGKKVRRYYLTLEKIFRRYCDEEFKRQMEEKQKIIEEKNKEIQSLSTNLLEEQKNNIKIKKSLTNFTKKFSYRYKFPEKDCIYILKDPDCKYCKHKIGITKNINQRLKSDRTMIPNIKVRAIFYTQHAELFEKIVKVKHADRLELPSHEWLFIELEELIASYEEIDRACGFNSEIEKNMWRYNMEDPVNPTQEHQTAITDTQSRVQRKPPKNIPNYQNKLEEKLDGILPSRLLRYDYRLRNKEAPQGHRYCNGFCQIYQPVSNFKARSTHLYTICNLCISMVDIANIRLSQGNVTKQQIRNDPNILRIGKNEQICRKCNKILDKKEFPAKRRQCKKCRNAMKSRFGKKFDEVVESEVKKLLETPSHQLKEKLGVYVKVELQKIMSFVKVGRKYNDRKVDMVKKLVKYFSES